jgi:hypothetical protein
MTGGASIDVVPRVAGPAQAQGGGARTWHPPMQEEAHASDAR